MIVSFKKNSKHLNIGLCFLLLYRLSVNESKALQDQAYEFVGLYYLTSEIQLFQSTCLWNVYQHTILLGNPTGVSEYSQGETAANVTAIEAGHTLGSHTVLHQCTAALTPPSTQPCLKENESADLLSYTTRKLNKKKSIHILETRLCTVH